MAFVMTEYGKPMTPAGFGNWFMECAHKAALPRGCTSHGLKKAACRRLAEAGCTPHQMQAISGHKTLREVERYTAAVSRTNLANSAMDALTRKDEMRTNTVKPNQKV
jgi:site-specific recombinase XerD